MTDKMKDEERAALQRRIKNQRKALKQLNRHATDQLRRLEFYREHVPLVRSQAYRHAAQLAETFHYWPFGKRIGAYIRKWI